MPVPAGVSSVVLTPFLDFMVGPVRVVLLWLAALAAVVLTAIFEPHMLPERLIAGAAAGGFLLVAVLAYPAGMGMGDVKLTLLLGAALGRTVPVALMAGMVAALVPSAVLFALHGGAARKMTIPFGPFLALGVEPIVLRRLAMRDLDEDLAASA